VISGSLAHVSLRVGGDSGMANFDGGVTLTRHISDCMENGKIHFLLIREKEKNQETFLGIS